VNVLFRIFSERYGQHYGLEVVSRAKASVNSVAGQQILGCLDSIDLGDLRGRSTPVFVKIKMYSEKQTHEYAL